MKVNAGNGSEKMGNVRKCNGYLWEVKLMVGNDELFGLVGYLWRDRIKNGSSIFDLNDADPFPKGFIGIDFVLHNIIFVK